MTPSNEHLVHAHLAERLAAAQAHKANRGTNERAEPQPAHRPAWRTLRALVLPIHPTRKGTPA